uniref:Zinc finger DHHC-type palmitoyltransferase 4 n=1 Tax=Catharus ustulatus TaxID=91951 RepID=A0A8C3V7T1_CATUS
WGLAASWIFFLPFLAVTGFIPLASFPQVVSLVIPSQLQRVTHQALHRLFHTRSCLFMVLHVALQAAVFGEYTWEVFVYCWELQFHLLLLLLPYLLLAGNLGCFLLCSRANPGTVTKSNAAALVQVYAYDGVLFQRGLVCPTCTVEKPARSKHCSKDLKSLDNRRACIALTITVCGSTTASGPPTLACSCSTCCP